MRWYASESRSEYEFNLFLRLAARGLTSWDLLTCRVSFAYFLIAFASERPHHQGFHCCLMVVNQLRIGRECASGKKQEWKKLMTYIKNSNGWRFFFGERSDSVRPWSNLDFSFWKAFHDIFLKLIEKFKFDLTINQPLYQSSRAAAGYLFILKTTVT